MLNHKKYFLYFKNNACTGSKSVVSTRRPVPPRGVSRSSRTRDGMRWTREVLLTRAFFRGRRSRVGLAPRRWCQVRVKARGRRWQTSPVHRGEHEVSRKTIARGMPGETGVTVVTTLVYFVFYRTRGCGRIKRPAFPAPSVSEEPDLKAKPRAKTCGENVELCPQLSSSATRLRQGFAGVAVLGRRSLGEGGKRMIQYSRGSSYGIERPRRTGSPGQAGR